MVAQTFTARLESRRGGGIAVRLPFDPSVAWGEKQRHYVTGTLAGRGLRGRLVRVGDAYEIHMGPAWCRGCGISAGGSASVRLEPEGPQLSTLPADVAAALEAEPDARRFFESLATFYRNGFTRWIEQAKRPETRARRIAETVTALKAGRREP
jgi:hypothetical protein